MRSGTFETKQTGLFFICLIITFLLAAGCDGGGGGGGGDNGGSNPTIPTELAANTISQTQLTLTWNASSDDSMVMGYLVSGGVPSPVTTMTTSHTFTGLSADTQYCLTVEAFDDEGNFSGAGSALCVTTEAPPSQAWITVREGITNPLPRLAWTGTQLVAIADSSSSSTTVMTSPNGVSWNRLPSSGFGFNGVEALAYTGSGFVGMNYGFSSATVFTSSDGIAWSMLMRVDPGPGRDFIWSPELNLFVLVGEDGFIATSPDASTWTTVNESADPSPVTTVDLYGVRSLGGVLFATGAEGSILTSADGSVWTQVNFDDTTLYLNDVAWNGMTGAGSLYVAVGYSSVYTSPDGATWTKQLGAPGGYNDRIVWGGAPANRFVTVGLDNHLYTSLDGVIWNQRFINNHTSSAQGTLYDVVWTGSLFVVTGDKGTILTSADGVNWTIRASGHTLNGVRYIGSEFIAVGDNGRIARSTDALAWDYEYTGDDAYYFKDVATDVNGTWILPGQTYMLRSHDDMSTWEEDWWGATSTDTAALWDGSRFLWAGDGTILGWDGVSLDEPLPGTFEPDWKWSHFASGEYYEDLHWDGSVYVVVGFGGVILTSDTAALADDAASATSWTERTNAAVTTDNLYAVTKGPGRHVAVGASGTIITSDDGGATWTARDSGFDGSLYDVAWTGADYVAVGYSGAILTSSDGVAWSVYDHGTGSLYSVETGGGEVVVVGERGQIIRRNIP